MSLQNNQLEKSFFKQSYLSMHTEESEIDMIELISLLLKYKHMILILVICSAAAAVIISLLMTNIYRSEATIALRESEKNASIGALGGLGGMVASQLGIGGGGSLEKLEVVLKSRDLSAQVIDKYELMPVLFSDDWDLQNKKWLVRKPPTLQDGMKEIKELLGVSTDLKKSTIAVGFNHKNPEISKNIVGYFLTELSNALRAEVMRDASENMRFFREELEKNSDAMLREKLYALLAKEIEKETFAKAQKYFGFLVIDPPIVPDLDKKVKPKRALICILTVFTALLSSVFLVFFLEFCKKTKAEDPVRFQQIVDGLKIWKFCSGKMAN